MKDKYKIPVGWCPKCESPVIYSKHGADKKYITVICVDEDYDGRTYMCHKCKSMLAVIDRNPCAAMISCPTFMSIQA